MAIVASASLFFRSLTLATIASVSAARSAQQAKLDGARAGAWAGCRVIALAQARGERHGALAQIVGLREKPAERLIGPADEPGCRAEIAPQLQRRQPDGADPEIAGAQEAADLGLAKLIDRLHRIADHEQRPAIAGLPAHGQRLEQIELRDGGVLELIHEDVPQRKSRTQGEIGRQPSLGERRSRGTGDVGVVNPALEREPRLQLHGRGPQHSRQGRERRGVRGAELRARQRQHIAQGLARRGHRAQPLDAGPQRLLGGGYLETSAESAVDPYAPVSLSLVGEREPRQGLPGLQAARLAPERADAGQAARRGAEIGAQ